MQKKMRMNSNVFNITEFLGSVGLGVRGEVSMEVCGEVSMAHCL